MADSQGDTGTATLDFESASARIGESILGPSDQPPAEQSEEQVVESPTQTSPLTQPTRATSATEPPPDLLPPPKSWRQDMHPHWGKMPKEAQQYYVEREKQMLDGMSQYKQIQQILAPYEPMLSQAGTT